MEDFFCGQHSKKESSWRFPKPNVSEECVRHFLLNSELRSPYHWSTLPKFQRMDVPKITTRFCNDSINISRVCFKMLYMHTHHWKRSHPTPTFPTKFLTNKKWAVFPGKERICGTHKHSTRNASTPTYQRRLTPEVGRWGEWCGDATINVGEN